MNNDELNRRPFANALAKLITEFPVSDLSCKIIAVEGEWGSGKTTTLGFLKENLVSLNGKDEYLIFEFKPWQYESGNALVSLYLQKLSDELRSYKGRNGFVFFLVSSVTFFYDIFIAFILSMLTAIGKWRIGHWFSLFGLVLRYKSQQEKSAQGKSKNLGNLKDAIIRRLKSNKFKYARIIVIIDDLDRLEPNEVWHMMQMVRSIADFPRLVYVLSYDKAHVTHALGLKFSDDKDSAVAYGSKYLQKITDVSVPLPEADQYTIASYAIDRFEKMASALFDRDKFSSSYWEDNAKKVNIFSGVFINMRDAERVVDKAYTLSLCMYDHSNPLDVFACSVLMEIYPKNWELVLKNDWTFKNKPNELKDKHYDVLVRDEADLSQKARYSVFSKFMSVIFPRKFSRKDVTHDPEEYRIDDDNHSLSYRSYALTLRGEYQREIYRAFRNDEYSFAELFSFLDGLDYLDWVTLPLTLKSKRELLDNDVDVRNKFFAEFFKHYDKSPAEFSEVYPILKNLLFENKIEHKHLNEIFIETLNSKSWSFPSQIITDYDDYLDEKSINQYKEVFRNDIIKDYDALGIILDNKAVAIIKAWKKVDFETFEKHRKKWFKNGKASWRIFEFFDSPAFGFDINAIVSVFDIKETADIINSVKLAISYIEKNQENKNDSLYEALQRIVENNKDK